MADELPLPSRFGCRSLSPFALLMLVVLSTGCGSDSARLSVYGTIAGAEHRDGLITFIPLEETSAPAARTVIRQGRYAFDGSDGPLPGRYRVEIQLVAEPDGEATRRVKDVEVPVEEAADLPLEYESFPGQEVSVSGDEATLKMDLSL